MPRTHREKIELVAFRNCQLWLMGYPNRKVNPGVYPTPAGRLKDAMTEIERIGHPERRSFCPESCVLGRKPMAVRLSEDFSLPLFRVVHTPEPSITATGA